MDPVLAMTLLGLIIFIGYISSLLFDKTKIPDLIILILLGILLGPLTHVLNPETLGGFSQYIAALALVVIMFEGGLSMRLYEVFKKSPRALALAITSFTITTLLVGLFCRFILGWDLLIGLLLGSIIGGSSSMVVIPILQTMGLTSGPGIILSLESAMTDGLCIVIAFTILQLLAFSGNAETTDVIQGVTSQFSVGIVVGLISGLVWLNVLHSIKGRPYDYMLSFAALFIVYGITEFLGGNGAMSILVFGIVMGNSAQIGSIFRMRHVASFSGRMREFHSQVTFFIRTFFFVYLGLLTSLSNPTTLLAGVGVLTVVIISRMLAVWINARTEEKITKTLMTLMMGRGLAAAVLATLPLSYGIAHAGTIADFTSIVIIGTALMTTAGVFTWKPEKNGNNKNTETSKK